MLNPDSDEEVSGDVIYTPVEPGQSPYDLPPPVVVSGDGNTYILPRPHVFNYGTTNSIILDDFNDNDHQNNLASAVATYGGYNSTEGGGFWYVFKDRDGATIKNVPNRNLPAGATLLDITGYNIIEAIGKNQICVNINAVSYAGIGTNILFEEYGTDLTGLSSIDITTSGSGSIEVFVDSTAIVTTGAQGWGKFKHSQAVSLGNSPQKTNFSVSGFTGEEYSDLAGTALAGNYLKTTSKIFFQKKTGPAVDICIHEIVLNFSNGNSQLVVGRLGANEWNKSKNQPYPKPGFTFVENTKGAPAAIDPTDPYIDWSTVQPVPAAPVQEVTPTPSLTSTNKPNWLSVDLQNPTKLRDSHGNLVRLTGVNWFGFETKNQVPFGLWSNSYKDVLQKIKDTGFNMVRIPYTDAIIDDYRGSKTIQLGNVDISLTLNNDLTATQTPLDLLDKIVAHARTLGLKIILDSHSRKPDMYLSEGHWAKEGYYPEAQWISNWVFLTERYKDNDAVIAMDLKNEPHFEANWNDTSKPNDDWTKAAERAGRAILAVNPNVLIIVEGVEKLTEDSKAVNAYWWGGNFQGVRDYQIDLPRKNLVYSPHEYGPEVYLQPWFRDYRFPNNLPFIWEDRFGFLYSEKIGHLFIGEFGVRDNTAGSAHIKWFDDFLEYMCDRSEGYSWAVWAWNPNSSDTGGIMQVDWENVHQWKLDKLAGCQAPLIGNNNGL